jgi:hypothetical protein
LFGTSFTAEPRLTAQKIEAIVGSSKDPAVSGARLDAVTPARLDDLIRAAVQPRASERLVFVRGTLTSKGFELATPAGRQQAKGYLLRTMARVFREVDGYARIIAEAERSNVPGEAFARRSGVYRARGLSSDTSLAPNFAIEEALKEIRAKGMLAAPVKRVAVIGPGLDFADKLEGYDFYPQQTLQPFAIVDSLLRLGLAGTDGVAVTTFDLSPRVNAHLEVVRAGALKGRSSVLQLPLDAEERWSPELLRYWLAFGDRIGVPVKPAVAPPSAGPLKLRAISVQPGVASRFIPLDVNIVVQRLELPADRKFDLMIGTNVFLYYDEFQQALAMTNVERMLRPGGLLLSNNALVELPSSRVRYVGNTTLTYSDRKGNGDTIVWYRCAE